MPPSGPVARLFLGLPFYIISHLSSGNKPNKKTAILFLPLFDPLLCEEARRGIRLIPLLKPVGVVMMVSLFPQTRSLTCVLTSSYLLMAGNVFKQSVV